jgi:hypothetical protein
MDRARLIFAAGLALLGAAVAPAQDKFQSKRAWDDLVKQVAFGPRNPGSDGHLKCRDWLQAEMKKSCDNVRLQEFRHYWSRDNKPKTMWNILGEQNWKDAKIRVVLIAHWDTRPTADQDYSPAAQQKPILGANDGASGVAVLLELMRAFKEQLPKDVGVQYLLTDGEDLGPELDEMFLGARAYARNIPTPRPDYGILLDMIGDKDLRVPMEPQSLRYARPIVRALYDHAKTIGLEKTFPSVEGPIIEDDHIPLNQAGLKTIDLIDFDYPAWHTQADTVDKCSAESLGKVGKLLESFLRKQPAFKP